MKKTLALALSVLVLLCGLPLVAAALVTLSTTAATTAAACITTNQGITGTAPLGGVGNLGVIDGPVGGPVTGELGIATANIPNRSGLAGLRASMPRVLSTRPDVVTLNEVSARTLAQIEAAAPGYQAYRETRADPGPGGGLQSMGNVVLWRTDTWMLRNAGRVKLVEDDRTFYAHRRVIWDRYATWTLLQRPRDGAVVSVISTHQMTNPQRYPRQHGHPPESRTVQYGHGMDTLLRLVGSLAIHGPVLVGGDMNTHASQAHLPWTAAAKMTTAGYDYYDHSLDYLFYPTTLGVRLLRGWDGPMASDHHWVAARLAMNGVGPSPSPTSSLGPTAPDVAGSADPALTDAEPGAPGDLWGQLRQVRLAPAAPTLSMDQAQNAVVIAQVARDLGVPARGLEIALATAIQQSTLRNLPGGDADSSGLFQQRPSAGWGTRAQITDPRRAALAFFGRAAHTDNPGLLDLPNWAELPLTEAAAEVQRPRADLRDAYARWEPVAHQLAGILGRGLRISPVPLSSGDGSCLIADSNLSPVCRDGDGRAGEAPAMSRTPLPAGAGTTTATGMGSTHADCEEVVYPVPARYVAADAHNWHAGGSHWASWHTGTDFAAPCGTPVYAAHAGTVEIDTTQTWAGPHLVRITAGADTLATWYAHLQTVTVSRGQPVRPGQVIGQTGDLGNATGCHLHFEVHLRNGPIYGPDNTNPSTWLAQHAHPPQG